ncbi:MAG: phenylalanine--tRNA ligase beta subunit-related protein [Lentilactobacillus hilgardii]|uniref:B3/B4 domain-containing protein n=1 Tax=Lentilactobacillus hilgardii TaxID=1588 RepID=UPI001CC1F62F|nr:phenylalanine--tRNA ligase beta subunit-related protein [Lentilactobacillus hilgardii]MBZ2201280.1 tRNA ligase [Lentilactobacillus hilgardii]MBZ2204950.1 tRNA ligase [Lentilactobacillus hilgardii]MCT3400537.1 tRNA ligase [Lentilactobacillus hilgardii]
MSQFIVQPGFWNLFPDVKIAVITVHNLDNHEKGQVPPKMLDEANAGVADLIPDEPISANPLIHEWRQAFKKFKTKKGARFAVENLLKRAKKGNPVRSIDPLVDLYNAISLRTGFPIGALDLDKIKGGISLEVAKGGESFTAIGEDQPDPALPGEVIYRDDEAVTSRCWAWRDAKRVETTEDSNSILMYSECLKPEWRETHEHAMTELTENIEKYLGATTKTQYVSFDHPAVSFE